MLKRQKCHLDSGLGEVDLERQLLSGVDIWVMCLGEHPLELFQLRAREGRADPPLLALLIESGRVREELVGN